MTDPRVFLKLPIKMDGICTVYPPTINEVLSNDGALQYTKLLTNSQEDIEDLFAQQKRQADQNKRTPTPLEFILGTAYSNKEFEKLLKDGFEFFIKEPVSFLYESKLVLIGKPEDLVKVEKMEQFRYLSEDNFFDFQNCIRLAMGLAIEKKPEKDEELNPIVAKIKAAGRRRQRIASKQHKGISLTVTLAAICCMGIGLTPLNIGEISYASINTLMTIYQQKEKYQTDLDSLMAGADPKKVKPKYWIREDSDFKEIKI